MKSSASVFALGALLSLGVVSGSALAQASIDVVVFETIDSYALASAGTAALSTLSVTGVVQGATAATTQSFSIDGGGTAASCDRIMAIALNRPGRFLVTVERLYTQGSYSRTCRLTRRP
jgi:hypothetical protein